MKTFTSAILVVFLATLAINIPVLNASGQNDTEDSDLPILEWGLSIDGFLDLGDSRPYEQYQENDWGENLEGEINYFGYDSTIIYTFDKKEGLVAVRILMEGSNTNKYYRTLSDYMERHYTLVLADDFEQQWSGPNEDISIYRDSGKGILVFYAKKNFMITDSVSTDELYIPGWGLSIDDFLVLDDSIRYERYQVEDGRENLEGETNYLGFDSTVTYTFDRENGLVVVRVFIEEKTGTAFDAIYDHFIKKDWPFKATSHNTEQIWSDDIVWVVVTRDETSGTSVEYTEKNFFLGKLSQ